MEIESLLERIEYHEGFKSKPYQDSLGVWTFGHGLTFITKAESSNIIRGRLPELEQELSNSIEFYDGLTDARKNVLIEMAYHLGVHGVLMFKNMLSAMQKGDYQMAANEMLDSKWARQTPSRALEEANIMKGK